MATEVSTISFNRGVPSMDSFPTAQIKQCAEAILEGDAPAVLQYGKPLGYRPLRELIGEWYQAAAEEIMISNGSLQILEFIATLFVQPGDTVFVDQPVYDRTITIFHRHAARVVGIPILKDGPDVSFLAEQLRHMTPKLFYSIPDFQNPSGATASLAQRKEVVRLAEEHGFWIVEDAPYRPLRYRGAEIPTLRSLQPQRVLHMSSFTKLVSPGIRVGYMVAPREVLEALAPIAANTYVCPGLLAEGIVYEFCRRGWLRPNIEKLQLLYGPKLDETLASLREHLPQAECVQPDGGYFVGITLPAGTSAVELRERARAANLILSDGRGFFAQGGGDRFLRLAFPALSIAEIRAGIRRLAGLVPA